MKWIKVQSEQDLPKRYDLYFIKLIYTAGYKMEAKDLDQIKEYFKQGIGIEWLDESINQDVSDIDVGNIGSDWKEIKRLIIEFMGEEFYNQAIAPLLQKEYKGDDLVSSVRQDEAATLATLSSQTLTQIEQKFVPPDEETDPNGESFKKVTDAYENWCILSAYLRNQYSLGIIEFRIAMQNDGHFIIHPFGKDGETVDMYLANRSSGIAAIMEAEEDETKRMIEVTDRINSNSNTSSQTLTQIEQNKKQTL